MAQAKNIETAFVIKGSVDSAFTSGLMEASKDAQALREQLTQLASLANQAGQFNTIARSIGSLKTALMTLSGKNDGGTAGDQLRGLRDSLKSGGISLWGAKADVQGITDAYKKAEQQLMSMHTPIQTAADKLQQLNTELSAMYTTLNKMSSMDTFAKKIDYTEEKLAGLTQGTKEYDQTLATLLSYQDKFNALNTELSASGVNMWNLTQKTQEFTAAAAMQEQVIAGMRSTIEADATAYRDLAKAYQTAHDEYLRMVSDQEAHAGRTYATYINTANSNNVYGLASDDPLLYANTTEGQLARDKQYNAQQEALRLQREQQQAEAQIRNRMNMSSFMGGLGGFSFGGLAMSTFAKTTPAYLAGAAIGTAYNVAKASVTESMEFSKIVSELQAYTSATDSQTAALRSVAIQLGLNTVFSASEVAKAMTYLGKAGWTTGQIQSGIGGVMNLAAASGEDISLVSSIVADTLGAFGMKAGEAQHFADVLAKTATRSNTDVGLIGETFKTSAPVAGALGYTIEDVSQMVGVLANVGIKGSRAGTTMRNVLNAIAGGFTLTGNQIGERKFSPIDNNGEQKSLRETIDELREVFSLMSNIEQVQNAQEIAGMRGYAGLLALVNASAEEYERLAEEIENASGAAQEMADTRLDNLAGDVKLLTDAFDTLKIKIGDELTPELRGVVQVATNAIRILAGESPQEMGEEGKSLWERMMYGTYGIAAKEAIQGTKQFIIHDENGWRINWGYNDVLENTVDAIDDAVVEATDAYEELYEAAKASLEGQFELWEEAAEIIPKDIDDLIEAQRTQEEYWKQYTSNLDNLYNRSAGIPGLSDFLQANANGSAESIAMIAGLAEASDAEIEAFMRAVNSAETARLNATEAQTSGLTVINNIYADGATETTVEKLEEVGNDIADTVARAIDEVHYRRAIREAAYA